MGFQGFSGSKWPGLVTHKRSKSFPERVPEENNSVLSSEAPHLQKWETNRSNVSINSKKKQSSSAEVEISLRQEILMLEKRLQDQVSVRCALEKALGYKNASHYFIDEASIIPKPAIDLIREISVLELEVKHLEQYLLSLYRKAFDPKISSLSPNKKNEEFISPLITTPRSRRLHFSRSCIEPSRETTPKAESQAYSNPTRENGGVFEEKFLDSSVQRTHPSLSQRAALPNRASPSADDLGKALRACHSQPLSMMEYGQNSSSHVISLAEHLGTCISDHLPETPNKLSEDMVRCMCTIYCQLAEPPRTNHGLSSPTSSLSSMGAFSPKEHSDMWGPGFRIDSSFDVRLDNPFHVEGLKDFSGPYSSMIEVHCIHRDSRKLEDIEHLLQHFRSLVSRLEEVEPRKMKHEEKLAFWINVHNALLMHAFLAYGIPLNSMKRMFLLVKAAYNVGRQIVSADVIQSSILGCQMSRPGQWLWMLLSSKSKFKTGDERRKAYRIERTEPLLYFALSSGSHSDPAVRVFTPTKIYQELEAAKKDYVRATFGVRKDNKILLPKIVDSFAKDSGLCQAGILEMVQQSLPDSLRKSVEKCQLAKKKKIEWAPHNFTFRYIIMKELVR